MEDFLSSLEELIDNAEDITAIEVMGALQLAQQRVAFDLLTGEDEEGDEGDEGGAE